MTTSLAVHAESDRAFAIDAATIVAVSVAICLAGDRLWFMTFYVPLVIGLRFGLRFRFVDRGAASRVHERRVEVIFFLVCLGVGAFNDWNSVVHHGIYDYQVPAIFPAWTTIPEWMLLYWGMILRFFATFAHWRGFAPPPAVGDDVHFGTRVISSPLLRVGLLSLLVLGTRQLVYRYYLDPVLSWLPFAAALVVYAALFRLRRSDLALLAAFLVGGPTIEILYIQVGKLHYYHLGWIGGVPLWIVLWWVLAVLVWRDFSGRLLRGLRAMRAASVPSSRVGGGLRLLLGSHDVSRGDDLSMR